MRLTTLFLDAGGVLMNPNWTRVAEVLGRLGLAASPGELARAEFQVKRALDDPGRIRASDDAARARLLFELVLARAGVTGPPEALGAAWEEIREHHRRHNLWESVPAEVPGALDRLRAAGLTLAVVSNANGTLRAHLARLGLAARFDQVLDSHEEGVEKPDPRIFRIALARCGARPETTLHVGDLYHVDVAGARAAGVHAALLDPAGLYPEADCPRFESLTAVADAVLDGSLP